ncbi:dihydrolipoamide acetyltransferase family protein [Truepera radiovictrix]|uniref:Dihydrolipoamide acetyltransferase component of pyruvate dehydrogenase complex n=1 Tax=Truepera radiovictrix (strain DSM 17093 / CIP 108686 / LMG 22925 / RQ-24) TaxID=649638 RepID=D7CTM6_TRURR|nr:dihydrolipoamide acetyltransferase family protein [Truepera radiovictrix]ADI13883.1 catalytic domain of components of various dehydrogenase complexes [Truepera radiovictrix DSM 17093]WMT57553.1 dihydrolipoamide acetyltransferase family protein [Truepera radiovictrix]
MPRELVLPELAESVVEGEIVKWLVAEGETVAQDQPVVEVMTDKVTVELPSPFAGTLEKHLVAEGAVVAVHDPIALFSDDATGTQEAGATAEEAPKLEVAEAPTADAPPVTPTGREPSVQAREERSIVEPSSGVGEDDGDALSLFKADKDDPGAPVYQVRRGAAPQAAKATGPYGRPLAVPAARKLARELGLELTAVAGSGPHGRIRVEDVRRAAEASAPAAAEPPSAPAPTPKAPAYKTPAGYEGLEERVPVRGLRRAIANQMVASHLQTVRTLHVDEVDVTELVALRERLKPLAERRGVKLSYLPFIMKAAVAALKRFPVLNASFDEERGEIVLKRFYNLGLAVATDVGLVVPVVKDVDRKSVLEIAGEVSALAAKAREGKLAPEDVRGGTFSITNIGSLGGLFSFPIINVPEAAILGVHSIKKRPVVLPDDTIAARQMLYLSLSFDHRLVDGAEAAQFTSYVIELLGSPESLMLEG